MADRRVCRECHRVLDSPDQQTCPACGSSSLTEDWAGYVVIGPPDRSRIAEEMGISETGKYALKVR